MGYLKENDISRLLKAQDNRCTSHPLFIVERNVRDYGYDSLYAEDYSWVDEEGREADEDLKLELERCGCDFPGNDEWKKVYYKDRWEFVTACFTEHGCKDYLIRNGHNLGRTRIYTCSAYRNHEWIAIRNLLMNVNSSVR